jgi:Na+-driven multidrug efflux pump
VKCGSGFCRVEHKARPLRGPMGVYMDRLNVWVTVRPFTLTHFTSLFSLALPMMVAYLAELGLPLTTTFYIGHLGSDVLGASSLASMYCNAFGFSILMGLAMGMDSLAPHAFGDGKRYNVDDIVVSVSKS